MSDERLDDETEMAIQVHANSYKVIGLDRRSHTGQINATNALRQRIRTLVEEARTAGLETYRKEGWR